MTTIRIGRREVSVSWTLLDRAIAQVSPARGLERWRTRVMMAAGGLGGYDGGRRDRRQTKRWRPAAASADADTLLDLPDLRGRARDLIRNVPIATGALATRTTNVVGPGLRLIAGIDHETLGISEAAADAMEREQEREFALFWQACDLSRCQHGDELAALAYRTQSESGDAIVIRRYRERAGEVYGTRLQLIEADRLSNPNRAADGDRIAGGVEVDADGAPVAYHVSSRHPGGLRLAAMTWERIEARDAQGRQLVIHMYDRLRPELTRGTPWLAPVIEHIKQLGNYTEAEVTAAVVSSLYTVFIKSVADDDANPIAGERDATLADNEVALAAGAVVGLANGEEAQFPAPMRPNAQFDPFVQSLLRQIGVALELPFELLIKHFTASYSASKAALEMAWQSFLKERGRLARALYQTAYEWMMEEAVATGRLNRPGFFGDPRIRMAYCGAEWRGPARPSLNPYQEAQADELDMRNGVKTGEQVCAERTGGEIEKKIGQRGKEETLKRAAGLAQEPPVQRAAEPPPRDSGGDAEDETQQARAIA
ncbi:MAG TPA: phage portal protein [Xanthobacteraceae bacterium]